MKAQYSVSAAELRKRFYGSTIYVCLEGHGNAQIDGTRYQFEENDVFVVPSWATLGLNAPGDVILFSFSDRPVQRALGLWREEKLRAPQR